jgi:hypothetical protein
MNQSTGLESPLEAGGLNTTNCRPPCRACVFLDFINNMHYRQISVDHGMSVNGLEKMCKVTNPLLSQHLSEGSETRNNFRLLASGF